MDFKARVIDYLNSIGNVSYEVNPWFYVYEMSDRWFTTEPIEVKCMFYDVKSVEEWLYRNGDEFGGFPANGYTIIIVDLRDLPSVTYKQLTSFLRRGHLTS